MRAIRRLRKRLIKLAAGHAYHQNVIRSDHRDERQAYLREHEIGTLIHYPAPIHLQPAYTKRRRGQSFPTCEQAVGEILSLPMYPQLTEEDIYTVADRIVQWTSS